jgi:cell division septum initiation protein DivIVA
MVQEAVSNGSADARAVGPVGQLGAAGGRFTLVRRGFDPQEVRAYLEHLADRLATMEGELQEERIRGELLSRRVALSNETAETTLSRHLADVIRSVDQARERSGDAGIESRSGNGKSEIVFTFNNNVTAVGSISSTCGTLGKTAVDSADPHNVVVRLNEVDCNQAFVTVTLTAVTDDQGHTLNSASVTFGVLFGDVTADGVVDEADIAAARAVQGRRTNNSNFRAGITADGGINFRDVGETKKYQGDALP